MILMMYVAEKLISLALVSKSQAINLRHDRAQEQSRNVNVTSIKRCDDPLNNPVCKCRRVVSVALESVKDRLRDLGYAWFLGWI